MGKQRSYRWHVKEVLSCYKSVNQLELLVDDLSQVLILLQSEKMDGEWEKECRYWLSLQLLIFEFFFNRVAGVEEADQEKIKVQLQKSYDVLDRLFSEKEISSGFKNLSKTFYRLTDSNGALTRSK